MLGKSLLFVSLFAMVAISNAVTDFLLIYEEYYDFGQGGQYASGPVQFDVYGSEPSYLIIDGQSGPVIALFPPTLSEFREVEADRLYKMPIERPVQDASLFRWRPNPMIETYPDGFRMCSSRIIPRYTNSYSWPMRSGCILWSSTAMDGRAMKSWWTL